MNLRGAWQSSNEYFIWMAKKGRNARKAAHGDRWFAYLVKCADDSLYTGIAKDVTRRCQQHNAGTASRYTRSRLPVVLVYKEVHQTRSLALRREAAIKAMTRLQKLGLIGSNRPRRARVSRDEPKPL
jgi:predicted GIY-YIG superfamily endonuclease